METGANFMNSVNINHQVPIILDVNAVAVSSCADNSLNSLIFRLYCYILKQAQCFSSVL